MLKLVLNGPINNIGSDEMMDWLRTGDTPLSEPMMAKSPDVFMRHSASMS